MTCPNCGSSRLKHKDERMKESSHMAAHHAGHPGIVLAVGVKGSNGWPYRAHTGSVRLSQVLSLLS